MRSKKCIAFFLSIFLIISMAFPATAADFPDDKNINTVFVVDDPQTETAEPAEPEEAAESAEPAEPEEATEPAEPEDAAESANTTEPEESILEKTATSGPCGANAEWAVTGTGSSLTIMISGSGAMNDYEEGKSPWYDKRKMITKIVISNGITHVGSYTFDSCVNADSVSLPDGLLSIGTGAFLKCSSLSSITFPKSLQVLDSEAFGACTKLNKVTIPNKIRDISLVFHGCTSLTDISLPAGLLDIDSAFLGCTSLQEIRLPDSVTMMNSAFSECERLIEVNIPSGVTELQSTFFCCEWLTSIIIPEGMRTIGYNAFQDSGLQSIFLPDGVQKIEAWAFSSCENLQSVYIPKSVTKIGDQAFAGCCEEYYDSVQGEDIYTSITTIYYAGTKANWEAIQFGSDAVPDYINVVFNADKVLVDGIKLNKSYLELKYGHEALLTVTLTPDNALFNNITWTSSNPKVATIDANHTVIAKSVGKTTITVASPNGKKASCTVRVLFRDVTDKTKAQFDAVYWGNDKGIVAGFSDGYFKPENNCTRAQFVLFLWRAAGKPAAKSTSLKFKDAADIEKLAPDYKKAILWGSEKGVVAGFTSGPNAGKFLPNDPCTRGQVVTFLWRYGGQKSAKAGAKTFPDVPKTHKYYKAIMWASSYGITTGFADGTFKPDQTCTRGQCVTFLYRMLK